MIRKLVNGRSPLPLSIVATVAETLAAIAGTGSAVLVPPRDAVPPPPAAAPETIGAALPAVKALRLVPFFEALTQEGWDDLHDRATKAARRGRLAGHVGKLGSHPNVPLPPMLPCEDADAATDAIADAWFAMATSKREGASPRALARRAARKVTRDAMRVKLGLEPVPAAEPVEGAVSLTCAIARRLGQRREAHRIRRYRTGLTVATDRTTPSFDAGATVDTLIDAVPPHRRPAFFRAAEARQWDRVRGMIPKGFLDAVGETLPWPRARKENRDAM